MSDVAIGMSAEQRTLNVRRELITTGIPSMIPTAAGDGSVVLPVYVNGADRATQVFLLDRGAGDKANLRFVGQDGDALPVILR